jgi:hypothetical protein
VPKPPTRIMATYNISNVRAILQDIHQLTLHFDCASKFSANLRLSRVRRFKIRGLELNTSERSWK